MPKVLILESISSSEGWNFRAGEIVTDAHPFHAVALALAKGAHARIAPPVECETCAAAREKATSKQTKEIR